MRQHKGCFTCVEFHVACSSIFDLFSLSVFYGKFIWKHTQSRVICHLSIPSAHLFSSAFLSSFSRSLFSSSSLSPKSCPSHLFLLYVLLFLFFISSFLLLSIKKFLPTHHLPTFSLPSLSHQFLLNPLHPPVATSTWISFEYVLVHSESRPLPRCGSIVRQSGSWPLGLGIRLWVRVIEVEGLFSKRQRPHTFWLVVSDSWYYSTDFSHSSHWFLTLCIHSAVVKY